MKYALARRQDIDGLGEIGLVAGAAGCERLAFSTASDTISRGGVACELPKPR